MPPETFASDELSWRVPPPVLTLDEGEAHVWRIRLNQPDERVRELARLLAPDEAARAARFHFEKDRTRFIVARGMLRTLLARYLRTSPGALAFDYSYYGKPSLAGQFSTSEIRFNLSHSHQLALCAFTRGREVGIDIEHMRPDMACDEIAQRFFSQVECATLSGLPAEQRTAGFFNCWTRKEAYIKARGEGLSFPLDKFSVSLSPGEATIILDVFDNPQETSRWTLHRLHPGDGYVAALTLEGTPARLHRFEADLERGLSGYPAT